MLVNYNLLDWAINCLQRLSDLMFLSPVFSFQVDNNKNCNNETSQVSGAELLSKIQNLENELAEALEANDMYKAQLKR